MRIPRPYLATLVSGLLALALAGGFFSAGQTSQAQPSATASRAFHAERLTVRIRLGLKDTEPTTWKGTVQVSTGRIAQAEPLRSGPGDRVQADGEFQVRSRAQTFLKRRTIVEGGLLLELEGSTDGAITLTSGDQTARWGVSDLLNGTPVFRLEGQASAQLVATSMAIADSDREEDFPAAAQTQDGSVYVGYVEHAHVGPADLPQLTEAPSDFASYRPRGGGDRLLLTRYTGGKWQPAIAASDEEEDLWRPSISVDGAGVVWLFWSKNLDGNWELLARGFDPAREDWIGPAARLTRSPGADVFVSSVRGASGDIWLAWQGWNGASFDIQVARWNGKELARAKSLGSPDANDWSPALAASADGKIYVAFDTYAAGNYDVQLAQIDEASGTVAQFAVADSPNFEVRPSVAVDRDQRVWIAWEERSPNWGKDDLGAIQKGPGHPIYRDGSRVRVASFQSNGIRFPADPLESVRPEAVRNMNSMPRLTAGADGRLWLTWRHREQQRGNRGTNWYSYAATLQGDSWSNPTLLMNSDGLLDCRPACVGWKDAQLLAIYAGDGRDRNNRGGELDYHLFAGVVRHRGEIREPVWHAAPTTVEPVTPVHPNEQQDLRQIRDFRWQVGGQTYQALRGEFHRHTEISSDGGGDGALEDMWRYALDAASMDWLGNGDHDNGGGREYTWWLTQKTTDIFHHAPHFIPMFSYERSVTFPDGHRNVMFAERGIRTLPRLKARDDENKPNNVSAADTPMLYRYLKEFNGLCAVHTSATDMGTDWRDNDPRVEPIVEIYQGDRHNYEHLGAPRSATPQTQVGGYQPEGFIWNAFGKGYRLGFQSSSDHISTHVSYAIAWAEQPTRAGILEAFQKRHCYAATDNIVLAVSCGTHIMGDEFETSAAPTLTIQAAGTRDIVKLSIVKDLKYVYTSGPNKKEFVVRWTDNDLQPGKTSWYYVRIEQEDTQLAWASPMWIKYVPQGK